MEYESNESDYDGLQLFVGWQNVPSDYATMNQWDWRHERAVVKGDSAQAVVSFCVLKKERIIHDNGEGGSIGDGWHVVSQKVVAPLYHRSQTRPMTPTPRTRAIKQFWRYFVEYSHSQFYIWCSADWISCMGRLRHELVKDHLSQKEDYGVRGHYDFTRFMAIDVDLHDGDRDVCLEQFSAVLDTLHGQEGWHYELKEREARGLHLIQVYDEPRPLQLERKRLRQILIELDHQHPDLASRAKAAGMKPFSTMEIYPDTQRGFRLPFGNGRALYLDKPLAQVKRGKQLVVDVEGYIQWTRNPVYASKSDVYQFVRHRLIESERPANTTQNQGSILLPTPSGQSERKPQNRSRVGTMKGRFAQYLISYWSGENCPPGSLNTAIHETAIMAPYYYTDQWEAIERIEGLVDQLPIDVSGRLTAGKRGEVIRISHPSQSIP